MWDIDSAVYVGYISAITSLIDTLPSDKSSSSPNVIFVFSVNLRLWLHWFLPGFERVHVIRRHNRTIMLNLSLSPSPCFSFLFYIIMLQKTVHLIFFYPFLCTLSLILNHVLKWEFYASNSSIVRCVYISHSRKTEPFVILRHVALTL